MTKLTLFLTQTTPNQKKVNYFSKKNGASLQDAPPWWS